MVAVPVFRTHTRKVEAENLVDGDGVYRQSTRLVGGLPAAPDDPLTTRPAVGPAVCKSVE